MRLTLATGLTSCILGVCLIQLCLAALPPNGAHDLDNAVQDRQPQNPNQGKPSPLHTNRLFNRAIRGPQVNAPTPRLNPQQKSPLAQPKTTTTTAAPVEAVQEDEENADESQVGNEDSSAKPEEEAAAPSTTSSTEATRKPFKGVLRPFRSNKDLLDTLKRRREMQRVQGYTVAPPVSSTTSEKSLNKHTQSSRKNGGSLTYKSGSSFSPDQASVTNQKKSTANRRYNTKTSPGISSTTPLTDAITEEDNVVPSQPTRSSRAYPKTRRLSS